ncbi:MAG: DUF6089 family protein [Deltaproteobacteria bacterium]
MKRIVYIILFVSISQFSYSQQSELGIGLGVCTYYGDLGRDNLKSIHPAFQVFYNYRFNAFLNTRLSFGMGTISGNDSYSTNAGQNQRNLSFRSNVNEFAGVLEFNYGGIGKNIIPYFYAGVNAFLFNPKTLYNGEWVYLRELGTEGQGSVHHPDKIKYSLLESSIVFGAGVKIAVTAHLAFSIDLGWRRTNTDYIDDVGGEYINYNELLRSNGELAAKLSDRTPEYLGITEHMNRETGAQRGGNSSGDYYVMSFLNVLYNLNGTYAVKNAKSVKCPKF